MENNILKPVSANKGARVTFYIFEIAALAIAVLFFILGLCEAIVYGDFLIFLNNFILMAVYSLIIYGIGRIIDLLYFKRESKQKETNE